ncbi:MAG TPA: type II secretion system minor pseudopilin GspJ [Gammaproteobacteria bacterium]|nr:type II secretion system minor pseudopilin GspJ [Gammaproteobacteria bacterium]
MAYKFFSPRILAPQASLPSRGFTLIEILLALFIFTLVALITTKALHSVLATQAGTAEVAEQLSETQMAVLLLSRDLEQALDRPITNATGQTEGAFIGSRNSLSLTHHGLSNPEASLQSSSLQRTRYHLEKDQLLRDTWETLDQEAHSRPHSRILLNNIQMLSFRYLDNKNIFHDFWPLHENNLATSSAAKNNPFSKALEILENSAATLPRAVEITFTFKHGGALQQIYLLPQQELPNEAH